MVLMKNQFMVASCTQQLKGGLIPDFLVYNSLHFESSPLTDGIFETGAYGVKVVQCSNPSWACRWRHPFGTNNYPPFDTVHKTKYLFSHWIFSFLAKIRLEITNIYGVVSVATCLNINEGVKMGQRWCQLPKNLTFFITSIHL